MKSINMYMIRCLCLATCYRYLTACQQSWVNSSKCSENDDVKNTPKYFDHTISARNRLVALPGFTLQSSHMTGPLLSTPQQHTPSIIVLGILNTRTHTQQSDVGSEYAGLLIEGLMAVLWSIRGSHSLSPSCAFVLKWHLTTVLGLSGRRERRWVSEWRSQYVAKLMVRRPYSWLISYCFTEWIGEGIMFIRWI